MNSPFSQDIPAWLSLDKTWTTKILPGVLSICALVVIVLGYVAYADCLTVSFTLTLRPLGNATAVAPIDSTYTHLFGYVAEPSHGILFVLAAPLFVYLSFSLLHSMSESFTDITSGSFPRLLHKAKTPRQLLRPGLLAGGLVVLGVSHSLIAEFQLLFKEADGSERHLGYVQAPYLPNWVDEFNAQADALSQWNLIPRKIRERLASDALEEVRRRISADPWRDLLLRSNGERDDLDVNGLDLQKLFDTGACRLNIAKAITDGRLSLTSGASGYPPKLNSHAPHTAFVIALCILEGSFHGFCAWIVIKIIAWLRYIYISIGNYRSRKFKESPCIIPDFEDPEYKYGIGALYRPYNIISILIALAAWAGMVNYTSNSIKGTFVLDDSVFYGQCFIWVGLVAIFAVTLAGPGFAFNFLFKSEKYKNIRKLNVEIHELPQGHPHIKALHDRAEVIKKQNCWPFDNNPNSRWWFHLACGMMVLLPLSLIPVPKLLREMLASWLGVDVSSIIELTVSCTSALARYFLHS